MHKRLVVQACKFVFRTLELTLKKKISIEDRGIYLNSSYRLGVSDTPLVTSQKRLAELRSSEFS